MLEIPVPAARVRDAIGASLEPVVSDMEHVRQGLWARDFADGIRAVVSIDPLKGASYVISYGVCCTWIPYRHRPVTAGNWPRTLKQTRKQLWVDHWNKDAPVGEEVSALCDEGTMRARAARAARETVDRAPEWWQRVTTPAGVLAEAQWQEDNSFAARSPRVVAAFTMAHMGDIAAAQAYLVATGLNHGLVDLLEHPR